MPATLERPQPATAIRPFTFEVDAEGNVFTARTVTFHSPGKQGPH
jgi:hypothetical protein